MTSAPLVSIIIPCYNDGVYLQEAVDSARAQTYAHCEIVVVNDHSDDLRTLNTLRGIAAQGIMVASTPEEKKGLPAARNTGIALAKGKYILPLDADDRIAPTYVSAAVNVLESRPEVAICYCKARLFGLKRGPWQLPAYDPEVLLYRNMIFATALFRKADWKAAGGYDEEARAGLEDHSFWLRFHAMGLRACQLQKELFFYRVRKHSMVAKLANAATHQEALQRLFVRNADYLQKNSFIVYRALDAALERESRQHRLLTYKVLSPILRLEWRLRQSVKRLLGRT